MWLCYFKWCCYCASMPSQGGCPNGNRIVAKLTLCFKILTTPRTVKVNVCLCKRKANQNLTRSTSGTGRLLHFAVESGCDKALIVQTEFDRFSVKPSDTRSDLWIKFSLCVCVGQRFTDYSLLTLWLTDRHSTYPVINPWYGLINQCDHQATMKV